MTYSCPKCGAVSEVDHSAIPADGANPTCPECKTHFWINRESFARRALKKNGTLHCVNCGSSLNHLIVCGGCGIRCPDYFLIQLSKVAGVQQQKTKVNVSFSLPTLGGKTKKTSFSKKSSSSPSLNPMLVNGALVVAVLVAVIGGTIGYLQVKERQEYVENYIRAIYLVKSGTELGLKVCARVTTDGQGRISSGQNTASRITPGEQKNLNGVKENIEAILARLNKTPPKFSSAKEKLQKYNEVFGRSYALASGQPAALPIMIASATKIEADFHAAGQELKAGMTPEMTEELAKAKLKHKGLQDF